MTTMTVDGRRRSTRRILVPFLAAILLATAGIVAGTPVTPVGPVAADEPPGPVAITEAPPLDWEFKGSWAAYAGPPATSGGVSLVVAPSGLYDLLWDFDHGTYDASTGTTVLQYRGTVHWTKYPLRDFPQFTPPGYTGSMDLPILDVSLTDPLVTISRDRADIVVDAISRHRDTMEIREFPGTSVVSLDVSAAVPVVTGTTTTWSDLVATGGSGSGDAFDGSYPPGLVIDPVSFSYTGPGGAPDFSDAFDAPGTAKLEEVQNEILYSNALDVSPTMWWYDEAGRIAHWRHQDFETGDQIYRAFSLDTMSWVGEPWVLTSGDPIAPSVVRFADPARGRAYYQSGQNIRWVGFDTTTGTYETGALAQPFPVTTAPANSSYAWDRVNHRAMNIRRVVPAGVGSTNYDAHVWTVATFTETDPDVWSRREYALPSFPTGMNQNGYVTSALASNGQVHMAGLPDGSLVVLGSRQLASSAPGTYPTAYRVVLADDGTATRQAVAGTDVPNSTNAYERIMTGPDGNMVLLRRSGPDVVMQRLRWDPATSTLTGGPVIEVPGVSVTSVAHIAIDPNDGTVWLGDEQGRRLVGVGDEAIVADQYVPHRHPRGGWIFVGPDSTVYAQSNDGSQPQFGGSMTLGIGKHRRLGYSPTVTGDPVPAAVALGVGVASEEVTFTSTAEGEPAPGRQWQVKAPRSARFADIAGETGETLTVAAKPGMDGSEYRALYTNAAGRIASAPAVLSVDHAPVITFQPLDAAVLEGEDAVFGLIASGTPEAEVTWQRYAGGFWWNIGPDDDGLTAEDGRLVVTATNVDQDGARFRARLRNEVGTVHTRTATLSVTERVVDRQFVVGGDLEWGTRESFRRYIVGPIAHGEITVEAPASTTDTGTYLFPADDGTVEDLAVEAGFDGAVRFTGHSTAGVPALDMRISDVRLAIDGQDGTLVADVVSRGLEDGELTTYDDVALAGLDLSGVTPTPVTGGLRWADVPATLTTEGAPAFADFYPAGDPLDPVSFTLSLSDDPSEPPADPRTPAESFVTAALADFLGAEPTEEQVAAAVTQVEASGKPTFLRSLTTSEAWLGAIVDGLYQDTLGRPADDAGAAFWVGRLRAGWSVARVAASLYASPEYDDGLGGDDSSWVTDLYTKILGRTPDDGGLAYWTAETRRRGRGIVALRFYQSDESARTRVTGLYRDLLGRDPEPGGVAYWSRRVVGEGDLTLAVHLAHSAEYQRRAERRYP